MQDNGLQTQINILAETCLRIMLNDSETRKKLIEIAESISGSSGVADDKEVDEMLDEIYH